jgi:hypothetical protein
MEPDEAAVKIQTAEQQPEPGREAQQPEQPEPPESRQQEQSQPEQREPEPEPKPEPEPESASEPEPEPEPEPEEARGVAYRVTRTPAMVACCICGATIAANPVSMCGPCIATTGNVAGSLPSRCDLQNCRTCNRYLLPRKVWAAADWESRELMAVCLKKLKGLSKLKLVDAQFIWTEPHSKRKRARGMS